MLPFLFSGCVSKSYHTKTVRTLQDDKAALMNKISEQRNQLATLRVKFKMKLNTMDRKNKEKVRHLRNSLACIQKLEKQLGIPKDMYDNFAKGFNSRVALGQINLQLRHGSLVLSLPNSITFSYNSTKLTREGQQVLAEVANVLKQYKHRWQIAGFTDATGANKFNRILSFRRANRVLTTLLEEGVSPKKSLCSSVRRVEACREQPDDRWSGTQPDALRSFFHPRFKPISLKRSVELSAIRT